MTRAVGRVLRLPLRMARAGISAAVLLALVGSLALNVGMVTASSVFAAVSGAMEALGAPTVRQGVDRRMRDLNARNRQMRTRASWQKVHLVQQKRWAEVRERQLGRATASITALKGQLAAASASGQRFQQERADRSKLVRSRSRGMARRVKTGTVRNLAAMAGEAAPFIGPAVIVGVTGLELYDACETLKDLRALDAAFNGESDIDATEVCGMQVPSVAELCTGIGLPATWCPAGPIAAEEIAP